MTRTTILATIPLALALSCSRPELPPPGLEASLARAVRRLEAHRELRETVEAAWQTARLASARPDGRLGDDRRAAAWSLAIGEAGRALIEARLRERQAADGWEVERRRAEAALASIASLPAGFVDRQIVAAVYEARACWSRAERRLRQGDLVAAAEAAAQASAAAGRALDRWDGWHARFEQPELRRLWRLWAAQAVEDSRREGAALLVDKNRHELQLWRRGRREATFAAELGRQGIERKLVAGDRATPEGRYRVREVRTGSQTRYFKALLLDYPNREDLQRLEQAIRAGLVPRGAAPGGLIEVHGHGGSGRDWTDGCVALRDEDLDALWPVARAGLSITIVGTVP